VEKKGALAPYLQWARNSTTSGREGKGGGVEKEGGEKEHIAYLLLKKTGHLTKKKRRLRDQGRASDVTFKSPSPPEEEPGRKKATSRS